MSSNDQLIAIVYRGDAACQGCPEAVKKLLENNPNHSITVTYAGPDEQTDITADTLKNAHIFAMAGGPDLDRGWRELKQYNTAIRDFVNSGGRYLGFCLGAFLAGNNPGFNLLPQSINPTREVLSANAETTSTKDTTVQVDWTFSTGNLTGQTKTQYMYFQDGANINLPNDTSAKILGRYTSNGNIAAALNSFGNGVVAVVGPHPEADQSWYRDARISNPDGINFDIGYDFVSAALVNKTINSTLPSGATAGTNGTSGGGSSMAPHVTPVSGTALLLLTLFWSFFGWNRLHSRFTVL